MSSEGNCRDCGAPLGISGTCYACAIEKDESPAAVRFKIAAAGNDGPKCDKCGGVMIHYRRHGYVCSANREHRGIVWPSEKV